MKTIFIVVSLSIWANGEPELIQFGSSVLGQSYKSRVDCEKRLEEVAAGQNMKREKGIRGILKNDLVFRTYGENNQISNQYSCLAITFME